MSVTKRCGEQAGRLFSDIIQQSLRVKDATYIFDTISLLYKTISNPESEIYKSKAFS
jgi:hypothetical protein